MSSLFSYTEIGVANGLVYGLLALGLVLVYKGSRTLNLAHPYFGLVCAFNCWWLTSKASFFPFTLMPFRANSTGRFIVAAILSLAIAGLNGYAIEHGVIRKLRSSPRLVVLVATIALAQGAVGGVAVLYLRTKTQGETFRRLPSILPQSVRFHLGTRTVTPADIQVLILAPVICGALALFFTKTKFGVAIRAAAENREAATLLGISAERVSVFTWVVGALLAGIAGILITEVRGSLDVGTLSTGFLVRGLAAALVGGLTSLPGAMVGGLIVGVAESLIPYLLHAQRGGPEAVLFVLVLAILLFRPRGLFGQADATEDKVAFVPTIRELPAVLRRTQAAQGVRIVQAVLVGALLLVPLVTGSKTTGILVLVLIYAIVAVSLTVLMGYAGQISLGHWGLVGVGAFTMGSLVTRVHLPYLVALVLTVAIGMGISLLIGLPALRIKGLYLAVATLSFNLAAEFLFFRSKLAGGSAGVSLKPQRIGFIKLGAPSNRPIFYFAVVLLGVSIVVARNLAQSRTGRGFFSLRENEKAASTLGVSLTRYKLIAFAVSGGIAALAGVVRVSYLGIAQSAQFPTEVSLTLVALVMIGGIGSLSGSIFGAFLVFGLPNLVHFSNGYIVPIGTGTLLLVVIIRFQGGVAGVLQSMRASVIGGLNELAGDTPRDTPSGPPSDPTRPADPSQVGAAATTITG